MTPLQLAKKALKIVDEAWFHCYIYASDGGKCSEGYSDSDYIHASKEEVLYLIKQRVGWDKIFNGLQLKKYDIEEKISYKAYECSWPDGGPRALVNECIPQELEDLNNDIANLEEPSEEELNSIRERIQAIESGEYTFSFDIKDGGGIYYFGEDVDIAISLTAKQAVGLLISENSDKKSVFRCIPRTKFDKSSINNKARKMGIAEDYDPFSYSGECESVENYLESWDTLLGMIYEGEVTEENLDKWLEYFKEGEYDDYLIVDWYDTIAEGNDDE